MLTSDLIVSIHFSVVMPFLVVYSNCRLGKTVEGILLDNIVGPMQLWGPISINGLVGAVGCIILGKARAAVRYRRVRKERW